MKKYIPQLFILLVICYLLFLIRPAIFGELTGTFKTHTVPSEYVDLEKFLNSEGSFFRTFWVPSIERYGYYSSTHPAVNAEDFYHVASVAGVLDNLKKEGIEKILQERSIKYIIVPYDAEGELFLKDRKYEVKLYEKTLLAMQKLSWLTELSGFGKTHVFVLKNPKGHFWINNNSTAYVTYQFINPTKYTVTIKNGRKGDIIVFTDAYDKNWQITVDSKQISSTPFNNVLNSFILPKNGNYSMMLYYTPQKWVDIGLFISGVSLLSILGYFIWFGMKKMVK